MVEKYSTECPIEYTVKVIGGKWKPIIMYFLFDGTKRISQLQRLIPRASRRMLTQHLRELEADGLIARKIYQQVPPKVEYSVTQKGRSLEAVLLTMLAWGEQYQPSEEITGIRSQEEGV